MHRIIALLLLTLALCACRTTTMPSYSGQISQLQDSTGLVYLGIKITPAQIQPYLDQLEQHLGDKFSLYRANQAKRDHNSFHLTLINPYEYQDLTTKIDVNQSIKIQLHGLGMVQRNADEQSYFVVASSADGQQFRASHQLKPKDFHVTLGFNPSDIYDQSKGLERLVE